MKTKIILIIGLYFGIMDCLAQDIHFSQIRFTPLHNNPAMAGAENGQQACLVYKDQWRNVTVPYKMFYGGYNIRVGEKSGRKGYFGTGLDFFTDKAGDANMGVTFINLSIAYHVMLSSKVSLGGGIQPGYGQKSMRPAALKWGTQFDGQNYNSSISSGEPNAGNMKIFDLNAGVVFTYKKGERYMTANDNLNITSGFSVGHITQPEYSFYSNSNEKLHRKYLLFAHGLIGTSNSKQSFMPGIYYTQQGTQREILIGTYLRKKLQEQTTHGKNGSAFAGGLFYRHLDAVSVKFLYQWSNYDFGLSYDINVSSLRKVSGYRGGIEVMLRWVTPNPFLDSTPRY